MSGDVAAVDERLVRPAPGQMSISMHLHEIDTRLLLIERSIAAMEKSTKDTARNIESLMVSIRSHPLISRFLVKSGG